MNTCGFCAHIGVIWEELAGPSKAQDVSEINFKKQHEMK